MAHNPPIDIRLVESEKEFRALGQHWNGLLSSSRSRSVFLTWEWVDSWWRFYGAGFRPFLLVALQDGRPCGIVPTILRSRAPSRIEFIGQNRAYGEYLDFIVPSGRESDVTAVLAGRLAEICSSGGAPGMNLGVILGTSPNLELIEQAFERRGVVLTRSGPRVSPFAKLPASWDDYLELKGSTLRKRISYNMRRLARLGDVQFDVARSEADATAFFNEFVTLHNQRWNYEQNTTFFAFHRDIARRFLPLGQLLLARLIVDGVTVAIKYDFVYASRVWGYQGGWLPDMARLEVGNVLLCKILQYCIEQGLEAYDFLEGDDWYKRRWSTHVLLSHDLCHGSAGGAYIF